MKILCMFVCIAAGVEAGFAAGTVYLYRLGALEVYTLVETTGPGRSQILAGADEALLKRYLPADFKSEINAFLVRGGGRTVLVDTGLGGAIFDNLKELGVSPAAVDAVLITHMHGDHIGGLAKDGKALFPNALVYLSAAERDYWTKTSVNAAAVAALAPYGNRVRTFVPEEPGAALTELVPGFTALAAYGHTPGHTAFLVSSGSARLLIWGDLMHVQSVQFPRPDISVTYDMDPAAAAETRKKILDYVAKNRIPVAGMHLLYPAIGTVRAGGEGYGWTAEK
ncbi:MAG: MBL fold metallo-hydrolase [Treponema sp.]|jgi:glyoxylase-like metal-dependent hydrolase (beta-lactamase superfamily II)|nr:MBL fold metallo-hydrolase [Treponema sp.]